MLFVFESHCWLIGWWRVLVFGSFEASFLPLTLCRFCDCWGGWDGRKNAPENFIQSSGFRISFRPGPSVVAQSRTRVNIYFQDPQLPPIFLFLANSPSTKSKFKEMLSLPRILTSLKIEDSNVIGAYLVGSRLWNTPTEASDYDIILITKSYPSTSPSSLHTRQADISILSLSNYQLLVSQGSFLHVLLRYLPPSHVLRALPPPQPALPTVAVFLSWVLDRVELDEQKAAKFFGKERKEEGNKILRHAARMCRVAENMVQHGTFLIPELEAPESVELDDHVRRLTNLMESRGKEMLQLNG